MMAHIFLLEKTSNKISPSTQKKATKSKYSEVCARNVKERLYHIAQIKLIAL